MCSWQRLFDVFRWLTDRLQSRRVGDGLEGFYFNCQISQDRRRQREHRLPPSRCQLWADVPKVVVRLGRQSLMLTLGRVFVRYAL